MIIINEPRGRLGNAIFRSLANIVFFIVYDINGSVSEEKMNIDLHMNDGAFIEWSSNVLSGNIPNINKNSVIYFDGYYQHDKIYLKYKNEICEYIKNHKYFKLVSEYACSYDIYNFIDLLNYKNRLYYDIVIHLRLEDFINYGLVMNPIYIKQIIDKIKINENTDKICIVVNKPQSELELKYINYLTNCNKNFIIESNDVITDFQIMANAKILLCSCSTLSWTASFFSKTLTKVYIPDYNNNRIHETFKYPIENTELYKFETCDPISLRSILNN